MSEQRLLYELLAANEIHRDTALRLAEYGAFVLQTNRRFNLTGAQSPLELMRHITDAFSILEYIGDPHVDVGSGAGFPGVPLALVTGVEIVLIESSAKKAGFLSQTLSRFGLRGQVIARRAEFAAHEPKWREHFASATARAVSSAPAVAELTVPFLRISGVAVLQRGRAAESEEEALTRACVVLRAGLPETVVSPAGGTFFLVRKERSTPDAFPRRVGVPQKRPLGTA
ncbi:MAG: 16S rRNA (guanine(527)-N(7))-methyltransferase RsmG [Candidatus Eremiobacteraeota bacterium]|nr:16S rRNA (guanine(527)-N(7))-methyltransferase RsmG [Candidatus Eremiobacteraeota bacterium]